MKTYGVRRDSPNVCPGEAACDRFQSAAGRTRADRVMNACSNCELLPTKIEGGKGGRALEAITATVMQARYERMAGLPRTAHELTTIEFHASWMTEQMFEQERVKIEGETKELLMTALGVRAR